MRGHIADMEKITMVCKKNNITLIEDCAHTMGATYNGIKSGNFGKVAAFSTQTYKHINSGEGGLLTTNHEDLAARAVVSSGSYMLYGRHGAIPTEKVFERVRLHSPNYSGRMDQLRAAILRSQLPLLNQKINQWNALYDYLFSNLSFIDGITIPSRKPKESYVGSSIQFRIEPYDQKKMIRFLTSCDTRGVQLKWFGDDEPKAYTSRYDSWAYIDDLPVLHKTLKVLSNTLDMRIPLTFSIDDCKLIIEIIKEEIANHFY
jgi:dTDP-4-amino-4,6-dideoxygalactose transaminase